MFSWLRHGRPLAWCFIAVVAVACGSGSTPAPQAVQVASSRYVGSLLRADGAVHLDVQLDFDRRDASRFSLRRVDAAHGAQSMEGRWTRLRSRTGSEVYTLTPDRPGEPAIVLVRSDQRLYAREVSADAAPVTGWLYRIDSPREADTLDLGPGDSVMPIALHRGQRVRVHLHASPATGYEWALDTPSQATLAIESDPGWAASSRSLRSWGFRALRNGRVTLRFGYRRPWESSAPPLRTATFDVLVR